MWTKTSVKETKWDDGNKIWTVELEREKDGKKETRNRRCVFLLQN